MPDLPQWRVKMLVKRYVHLTVEASSEAEAREKADDWQHVGCEDGDTIDFEIADIRREGG